MLDTFRGSLFLTADGRIGLRSARWIDPLDSDEIPPDAIVSARIERRTGLLNEFNAVKVRFTSPAHQWQEQQAHTIRDEAAVERLGREVVDETVLPMVVSHTQAQRLAKIELYEDNPEWLGEFVCHGAVALRLIGKAVFPYRDPDLDLVVAARITRLTIARDLSTATIAWESVTEETYAWDPETEEGPPPALPPDTSTDPLNPGPPFALSSITDTESASLVRVALRWRATERPGQAYDLRWRRSPTDAWQTVTGLTQLTYMLPPQPAGADPWDWEVRLRTTQGGVSLWAASSFTDEAFTAVALAPPAGLAAAGGTEAITLSATQSPAVEAWAVEFSVVPTGQPADWTAPVTVVAAASAAASTVAPASEGVKDVFARAVSPLRTLVSSVIGPVAATVAGLPPGGASGGGTAGDGGASGDGGGTSTGGAGGVPGSSGGSTGGDTGGGVGGIY